MLVHSDFPHAKELLRKLPAILTPPKIFASSVLGRKRLKNFGFEGRYSISVPGASVCLGSALDYLISAINFSNISFGKYHCNVVQCTYK